MPITCPGNSCSKKGPGTWHRGLVAYVVQKSDSLTPSVGFLLSKSTASFPGSLCPTIGPSSEGFGKTHYLCVHLCVCVSICYTSSSERGGLRTVPKALELELQVDVSLLMWAQGTPAPPSGRVGSPLNCRAIFPAQKAFACLYLSCLQQESFILNRNSPRGLYSLLLMPWETPGTFVPTVVFREPANPFRLPGQQCSLELRNIFFVRTLVSHTDLLKWFLFGIESMI